MLNKTKRTSFDILLENSEALTDYSKKTGSNFSSIINSLIRNVLHADEDVKSSIYEFSATKIHDLEEEATYAGRFEKESINLKISEFRNIMKFFEPARKNHDAQFSGQKKIYLKEGYILVPDNPGWIILDNFSNPSDCLYAGIIEIRQPLEGEKTYSNDHYIFFSNYKYGREYTDEFHDKLYEAACEKNPNFKKILNAIVEPKYDGEPLFKNMTNLDEYKKSPAIGLFAVPVKGDPMYWTTPDTIYNPPFGIMILK